MNLEHVPEELGHVHIFAAAPGWKQPSVPESMKVLAKGLQVVRGSRAFELRVWVTRMFSSQHTIVLRTRPKIPNISNAVPDPLIWQPGGQRAHDLDRAGARGAISRAGRP